MTRTSHYSHPTQSFPVYCLDWADDSAVILGGGGGASRSGIANKFKLCNVSPDGKKVDQVFEIALSSDEDAPMTLALDRPTQKFVTGINSSMASIQDGSNKQCRLFSYANKEIAFVKSQQTISAAWSDDYPYQRLTAVSQSSESSGGFVAVGSTENQVAILRLPSLDIVVPPFDVAGGDLVDLDWGGPKNSWLAVASASKIDLYEFDLSEKPNLNLLHSIPRPSFDNVPLAFRAARFSPQSTSAPSVYAVVNSTNAPSRRGSGAKQSRKAYVAEFSATVSDEPSQDDDGNDKEEKHRTKGIKWELNLKREVAQKPITVFDISSDGQLLSYGGSDLTIGLLHTKTLAPLLKILQAHSFPPTALRFNPSGSLIMSASADNTLRVIVVPSSFGGDATLYLFIIALLIVLVAYLLSK